MKKNKKIKTAADGNSNERRNSVALEKDEKKKLPESELTKAAESVAEASSAVRETTAQNTDSADPVKPDLTGESAQTGDEGYNFTQTIKDRLLRENPVFVRAIVLVPILGAATTIKNGILISCAMLLTVVLLNLIAYPLYGRIPRGYRFASLFLMAGVAVTPAAFLAGFIAPTVAAQCSIYLPLIAVGAMALVEKKHFAKPLGLPKTLLDATFSGLGFTFAAVVFSALREILGNGTLYDRALPLVNARFSFVLTPAGAFILLGVVIALFRKRYDYKEDGTQNNAGGEAK